MELQDWSSERGVVSAVEAEVTRRRALMRLVSLEEDLSSPIAVRALLLATFLTSSRLLSTVLLSSVVEIEGTSKGLSKCFSRGKDGLNDKESFSGTSVGGGEGIGEHGIASVVESFSTFSFSTSCDRDRLVDFILLLLLLLDR